MKNKLGVIVIGQSPRPDCVELFGKCLFDGDEVIVKGALDEVSPEELEEFKHRENEEILVALDRNLEPITVPEAEVKNRMQGKIREMEREGVTMITVYCSGRFDKLESSVPLVLPGAILEHNILAIAEGRKVSVLVPDAEQIDRTYKQFEALGVIPFVTSASPFGSRELLREACEKAAEFGPDIIVMDCTSFNREIRDFARNVTGKPVITAESIYLKVISELAGK